MSTEARFSGNFKIAGFQQTVRGDTFEDYVVDLSRFSGHPDVEAALALVNGTPMSEAQAVATITNALGATVVASPAPAFTAAMPAAVVAPTVTAVAAPSVGGGKVCSHGQMTAKQGVGKDGKTWRGYMCPAPQGAVDKCKNVYIYPSSPEWNTFVAG